MLFFPTRNGNDTKSFPFPRTKWLLMGRTQTRTRPRDLLHVRCVEILCRTYVYNLRLRQWRMMCQKLQHPKDSRAQKIHPYIRIYGYGREGSNFLFIFMSNFVRCHAFLLQCKKYDCSRWNLLLFVRLPPQERTSTGIRETLPEWQWCLEK